jgi:peptidoglycan/LPS O-acetylase OafA/YrhL
MRSGFSANLDLLRAIAVLLVLAQHLLVRLYIDHVWWIPSNCLGWFGVLLFFVHTTLVLMESLHRQQEGIFGPFYLRRFFRIYPLSIFAVAVVCLLHLDSNINGIRGLSYGPRPGVVTIVSNFLLVQNLVGAKSILNVLWSLPFEVQMYVFLPVIFLLARKRSPWPLLGLWAISLPFAVLISRPGGLWVNFISLLGYVPNFLPGAIAFALLARARPKFPNWTWPIFILGLVFAFTIFPNNAAGWILCLVLGLAAPYFAEVRSARVNWVSNRIATYSYGIYISHQFCIWFCLGVLSGYSAWVKVPLLICLLVAVPVMLYHAIERPMILLGKRLANGLSRGKMAQSAAA